MARKAMPKDTIPAPDPIATMLTGQTASAPEPQPSGDTANQKAGHMAGQQDGDMVKVTYRLPADLVRRLRHAYADQSTTQERQTMSDMVAEALRRYLAPGG